MVIKNSPAQPTDRTDETYALINQFLASGDMTRIAKKLDVTIGAVSRVASGDARSQRIWAELVKTAIKRRTERVEFTKYMKAS